MEVDLKESTPWFIEVFVPRPSAFMSFLEERGIKTRKMYPPVHRQKIYKQYYKPKDFPVSKKWSRKGVWLPSSLSLTNKDIDYICENIICYFEK
jgi:dTDP-4-amino-4,6-dideoxygalactose transaminase